MTYEKLSSFVIYVRLMQERDLDVFAITSAFKGGGKSTSNIQCARKYIQAFGLKCADCNHEWVYTGRCDACRKNKTTKLCKDCSSALKSVKGEMVVREDLSEACFKCGSLNNKRVKELNFEKYLAYDNTEIYDMIHDLPDFSPLLGDEGVRIIMAEDWNTPEAKRLKRLVAQMRTKHLFFLVNIQKFQWVEGKYRNDMTTFWIRLLKRGLAVFLQPDLGENVDSWHLKEFNELLGSYNYLTTDEELTEKAELLKRKHPCVFDYFRVPDLPKEIYDEYLAIRNKKAFERKELETNIDQKDAGKIAAFNLINNWGKITDAVNAGRFDRPTLKILESEVFCHPKTGENTVRYTTIRNWVDEIGSASQKK